MGHVSDVPKASNATTPSAVGDTGGTKPLAEGAEVGIERHGQEATDRLVERLTDRADLAEQMHEASWFQDHPDALSVAGILAVLSGLWAKMRRAARVTRPRSRP